MPAAPAERIVVSAARTTADMAEAARLFRAYAASLSVDLAYQGFEEEVRALPGNYAPPRGELLLARRGDGLAIGCVALRPWESEGAAEMKRLYVAPEGRGLGVGRRLVRAVVDAARQAGYREIRLDSLPTMGPAIALYRSCGFEPTAPYYDTPVAGTVFLRLDLRP